MDKMDTIIETPENEAAQTPEGVAEQNAELIEVTESKSSARCYFERVLTMADADATTDQPTATTENADLYSVTPPRYTESIAEGETAVEASASQDDKPSVPEQPTSHDSLDLASPRALSDHADPPRPTTPLHVLQERARGNTPLAPTGPAPKLTHYLTDPATTVSLIGVRTCSILRDRPAIWLVKNKTMALSPLAAAVLTKEGLINPRQLEL
jgi:hypothetical protein